MSKIDEMAVATQKVINWIYKNGSAYHNEYYFDCGDLGILCMTWHRAKWTPMWLEKEQFMDMKDVKDE
jgi:hypothetical protein